MSYIDRQALLEKLKYMGDFNICIDYVTDEDIMSVPSADVRENIHGHWEMRYPTTEQIRNCTELYFCSNCKHCEVSRDLMRWYSFCPNCGADMRGEE